jgi:hypothetical protein
VVIYGAGYLLVSRVAEDWGEVTTEVRHSIHRSAPAYVDLDTTRAIFETVFIMELINNIARQMFRER